MSPPAAPAPSGGARRRAPRWRPAIPAVLLGASALAAGLLPAPGPAAPADMVRVPAGPFWMGRDDGPPEERPRHRVELDEFWIDRHKVTNAAFAEFLNAAGAWSPEGERRYEDDDPDARIHRVPVPGAPADAPAPWVPDPGFERHPAAEVTWFGARDYCRWRGARLPTEAEWEKAARGTDGRRYPWGAAPPTPRHAVFGRRYNATEPTDGRPAGRSPWGVEDLLGNLREWTATRFRPYPYRRDDGRDAFTGEGRVVVRGASHDEPAEALSVTARHSYDRAGAAAGHHHVGFRCAR